MRRLAAKVLAVNSCGIKRLLHGAPTMMVPRIREDDGFLSTVTSTDKAPGRAFNLSFPRTREPSECVQCSPETASCHHCSAFQPTL